MRRVEATRAVYLLPILVSGAAIIYVLASGQWDRVANQWGSALTMAFGSFLAGSSPEGGGAVAFPVFTKVLHVEAPVARTFGLMIQAVGMTSASAFILVRRRPIDIRATMTAALGGTSGLIVAFILLTDSDEIFRAPVIPSAWVKMMFTVLLATMSWIMVTALRNGQSQSTDQVRWTSRIGAGVFVAAALGGVLSAMTGTGVNVMLFLFVVTLCGTKASIAVPSSIIAMTVVSIVGFVLFGLVDGQLSIGLDAAGQVISVGGSTVGPLDPSRFDLFALWLAAVPIVVWGAPIGALVISRVREERLVAFVALLAALEVVTTLVLVTEIRTNRALLATTIILLCAIPIVVKALERGQHRLLGVTEPVPA